MDFKDSVNDLPGSMKDSNNYDFRTTANDGIKEAKRMTMMTSPMRPR